MYSGLYVKYPLFLYDFNETWIFPADFEKSSNIKLRDKPSSGRRVVACGRTDRNDEANSHFTQFCEHA